MDGVRHRTDSGRKHLAKYGATFEPPKDDAVHYPDDDTHTFFARGRDYESAYVNHQYTAKERETLGTYESADYLPSHSEVYKHWLKRQPKRLDWDRWVMMGIIGFAVGFIGFLLHQIIDVLSDVRWDKAKEYIAEEDFLLAWVWVMGFSLLFLLLSASSVVFLRPSAGGSGIPELIGFLNGTVVRHIFNIKTMAVKFFSCCFAVGSGMPVGPEGPMIHLGSLVGAGLSQFKSDTLKIKLPFFERFRNSEDRRNFISAGAAAGVASAFGAPVGGLLFSMEEVSSFWNEKLSWQIFFCCMVSTFTTDLFNSAFEAFSYDGEFGLFKTDRYILFQVKNGLAVNILAFIPTVIIGVCGGVLGALFTFVNLKIARTRKRILSNVNSDWKQKVIRLVEPVIIIICFVTISVFLPLAFGCTKVACAHPIGGNSSLCLNTPNPFLVEKDVENYTCPQWTTIVDGNATWSNGSFNQVATLLFVNGEHAIHHLFSRGTHLQFDYGPLVTVLVIYFFFACWSSGTSISSGLVVPMLYIGGCYGRIIGRAMVDMFGVHNEGVDDYWSWMDPGAFALIGAASFFGGVSRLTMSLTVIMMEITNDIQFLLPIMVGVMVAKWMGDFVTHPLYHALLELKCIPHLSAEPVVVHEGSKTVNLELYSAKHVMSSPAVCVHHMEPVQRLAHLLLDTPHGGFPLYEKTQEGDEVFGGFITRLEITVLLMNEDMFSSTDMPPLEELEVTHVEYQQLTLDKLSNPERTQQILQQYCDDPKYANLYVNLHPYVNQSAVSLSENFSLHRTYIIFRTLGLRHLTVVNHHNHIMGVITRKDLMGFNLEEKLLTIEHQRHAREEGNVEMSEGTLQLVM